MGVEFTTSEAADGNQTDVVAVGESGFARGFAVGFQQRRYGREVSGRAVVLAVGSFCCGFLLLVDLDGLLGGGDGVWL